MRPCPVRIGLVTLLYGLVALWLCIGALLPGCGSYAGTPKLPDAAMYVPDYDQLESFGGPAPEYQQLDAYAAEVAGRGGR